MTSATTPTEWPDAAVSVAASRGEPSRRRRARPRPVVVAHRWPSCSLDQITKWLVVRRICRSTTAVTVIPGLLDLVHVHNAGVAFGLHERRRSPLQVRFTTGLALVALVRHRATTRATSGRDERWRADRPLADSRRRGRQPHRPRPSGYVVDFVDVYWRDWHFWAFNVADAAITRRRRARLPRTLLRQSPCIPSCLKSADWPVYAYGVLLAVAYLAALQLAVVRADARPRRHQGHGPRHLPHHRRARRRQADAGRRGLRLLPSRSRANCCRWSAPAASSTAACSPPLAVALCAGAPLRAADLDDGRPVRARHRPRPCDRPARLPAGRLLLRRPTDVPWGNHVHRTRSRSPTSARRSESAAPDAALRRGRGAADPGCSLATERGPAVCWPHVLALHAALRRLALRHRVLPRRRRGIVGRVDVAVRLGHRRAARLS